MLGGDATITTPMGEIKINKNADASGTPGQATITTPAGNAVITTTPAAPGTPTDSATMTIQTPKGEVKIDMKNMEAMDKVSSLYPCSFKEQNRSIARVLIA